MRDLRREMLNYLEVAAWDARRRRELGFFAGLRCFERHRHETLLLCRHWPHRLCWSWLIVLRRVRTELGYHRGFSAWFPSQNSFGCRLWSHELYFQRQRTSWWMAAVGPEKAAAPQPVWRRQFTNPDLPDARSA